MVEQSEFAPTIIRAQAFAQIIRRRQFEQFDAWLERAEASGLASFIRFSRSLRDDYDAVKAGVNFSVSNGQVEGQMNRLKTLKRQTYGRAGINLLERRLLLAS